MLAGGRSEGSLRQAGLLFALAASLEGLSEPAYLLCQAGLVTSMRAVSEGAAMLVRSALTFLLLVYVLPGGKRGLLAFGLAQVGGRPLPSWAPSLLSRTRGLLLVVLVVGFLSCHAHR